MMERRSFLKNTVLGAAALSAGSLLTYGSNSLNNLKISLAQWSLHRNFNNGNLDPVDFAGIAINTYGINAIEYVNQFYKDSGEDEKFWINMKKRADNVDVKSLLIMVDDEGDLGITNDKERQKSIENHYKWVNAAKILGCHSVRVNAFGEDSKEAYSAAIIDSMGRLADYAAKENINIIIENHGLYSSNAKLITGIIKQVNKPNFGTIPDFGNWCLSAKWGTTQGECSEAYDMYQGVSEFLPYAKAVSAKSYNFNDKGEDTKIDYYKMLKIVKNSGYSGHIGIEYEGEILSEHEGILATKALIEKVWKSLE
ncbi:MAG: TIM barrel protein [Bacteroidetes bacterium]|nr:TIM barrel protein [Bacteroidota bacterium]